MHALIYDNDRLRIAMLARSIKEMGLDGTATMAVEDIKRRMKKRNFDLLILDSSAIGVLERLREMDANVPIIIIAQPEDKLDFEVLIQYSISGFVYRPYRIDFFKKIIDQALLQRQTILMNTRTMISLKQKIQELEVLNEIVQAINSSLKPKEILQIIMEKTADLIKAEGWSVLLLDRDKNELVFEAAAGEAGKKLIGMRLKVGQGVAGWVARYGQSLIVPDVTTDPRFYSGVDRQTKFITKSILCVPMRSRDKIIGVVEVVNKIGGEPFTESDLEIFESLVAHVTIALENAAIYRRMEEASLIDDLTQLYNIRYGNMFLDRIFSQRRDLQSPVSLIFLDIDYFKLVDDNYGHLVGSETLRLVGERIKKVVRSGDIVIRYGGDEYIVILPNTDKKTAAIVAERIRREVNHESFLAFGRKKFNITVTLGVATAPGDAATRDDLIGRADKAMYEGKIAGRDKVILA